MITSVCAAPQAEKEDERWDELGHEGEGGDGDDRRGQPGECDRAGGEAAVQGRQQYARREAAEGGGREQQPDPGPLSGRPSACTP